MSRISQSILFAATAVAIGLASPAAAGAKSIDVSYADLDLSTGKGQRALKDRVRNAIVKLCYSGEQSQAASREFADCQRDAKAKMKTEVDALFAAAGSGGASGPGVIKVSRAIAER